MSNTPLDTSHIRWHDYFYYDETSSSCLRWRATKIKSDGKECVNAKKGNMAGCLVKDTNRWTVKLNGKSYKTYRIIWEMFNNPVVEGNQIDHINGDSGDNKISNLREIPREMNCRNFKMNIKNSTGITGVTKCFSRGHYYYVASSFTSDGKRQRKSFAVTKLGEQRAFQLACDCRKKMIEELNAQGMGYTERHGKPLDTTQQQVL